jgi:hypothetical protein
MLKLAEEEAELVGDGRRAGGRRSRFGAGGAIVYANGGRETRVPATRPLERDPTGAGGRVLPRLRRCRVPPATGPRPGPPGARAAVVGAMLR